MMTTLDITSSADDREVVVIVGGEDGGDGGDGRGSEPELTLVPDTMSQMSSSW
jgi:hypothetical protein